MNATVPGPHCVFNFIFAQLSHADESISRSPEKKATETVDNIEMDSAESRIAKNGEKETRSFALPRVPKIRVTRRKKSSRRGEGRELEQYGGDLSEILFRYVSTAS